MAGRVQLVDSLRKLGLIEMRLRRLNSG
jgi:hypothetical protein